MYTARYAERKPGLDKSQGCWHCIILYYPLISMYNQKYKRPFRTIEEGPVTGKSGFPCVFFTLFSGWIPIWGVEAHHVYLLVLASKTDVRGSLPGASVRNSAHGKSHEEGGLAYAKVWSSLRKPLMFLSIYPKTRVCFMLSPITVFLGEGVNMQLQGNKNSWAWQECFSLRTALKVI